MSRRTFKVVKETPELKVGTIVQEECDDGDQDYVTLDEKGNKFKDQTGTRYSRHVVEKQPMWFEEVFPAVDIYLSKDDLKKFKAFMRAKK